MQVIVVLWSEKKTAANTVLGAGWERGFGTVCQERVGEKE